MLDQPITSVSTDTLNLVKLMSFNPDWNKSTNRKKVPDKKGLDK